MHSENLEDFPETVKLLKKLEDFPKDKKKREEEADKAVKENLKKLREERKKMDGATLFIIGIGTCLAVCAIYYFFKKQTEGESVSEFSSVPAQTGGASGTVYAFRVKASHLKDSIKDGRIVPERAADLTGKGRYWSGSAESWQAGENAPVKVLSLKKIEVLPENQEELVIVSFLEKENFSAQKQNFSDYARKDHLEKSCRERKLEAGEIWKLDPLKNYFKNCGFK